MTVGCATMSKKNSKAMRRKKQAHAVMLEKKYEEARKRKRETKAVNRVRRASSIQAESQRAQMAAAAAAVPETAEDTVALMPPPAVPKVVPSPSTAELAGSASGGSSVPRRLPKPKPRRRLRSGVPGANLLMATFAAKEVDAAESEHSDAMQVEHSPKFVRERRLSKSEMASLRFDPVKMTRGPSKGIRKRRGPKAQQLVLNRLARAAARRAGAETMKLSES